MKPYHVIQTERALEAAVRRHHRRRSVQAAAAAEEPCPFCGSREKAFCASMATHTTARCRDCGVEWTWRES